MSIKPKLNLFDTTMITISLVIGIGIFRTPAIVARETGSPELFFSAWIAGGFICLIGGLLFAEIGSERPAAGGFYKFLSEAYSPAIAFMFNWLGIIITASATFAAVSLIASEYFIQSMGDIQPFINPELLKSQTGIQIMATAIVLVLFLINFLGIKAGAITLNFITIFKILIILVLGVLSFFYISNNNPTNISQISHPASYYGMILALFLGLKAVFFTVGGYQLTTNMAADVKNPRKNLPLGIIIGVFIVIGLYLLINFSYYKILGFDGIVKADLIASDLAKAIFGRIGSKIASFSIFISALGFMNATIMYTQRTYYAMAEDKVIPRIFMKVNEKNQVQEFALIFMFLLILIFILTQGTFDKILNSIMFNYSITIAITASKVFIFRYRAKKQNITSSGFKTPLYPLLPAIFVIFLLIVSCVSFYKDIISGIISIVILLLCFPLYKLMFKYSN